jgi:hypothetical protein
MNQEPWFRARTGRFSHGWMPITWQGWLVTLIGVLVILGLNLGFVAYVILTRRY